MTNDERAQRRQTIADVALRRLVERQVPDDNDVEDIEDDDVTNNYVGERLR